MRRRQAPLWPLMALTVAIALMAFILSFDALRTLAVACGVQPGLSWMFPLIIDAPVLAFTWATWVFKTRGLGQAYPWAMLLVFSAVSLVGNALHAHPVETNGLLLPDWGASLLMTMPPVALLATSHMIVRAASRSFDMDDPEPAAEAVPDVPRDMDDPAPAPGAPVEAEPAAEAVETTPVAPPEVPRNTDGPETVSEAPAEAGPEPEPAAEAVETAPVAPPEVPRADGPKTASGSPVEPVVARRHPDVSAPIPVPTPEPEPESEPTPEPGRTPEAPSEPDAPETLEERWGRAFAGDGRDRLVDLIEPEA